MLASEVYHYLAPALAAQTPPLSASLHRQVGGATVVCGGRLIRIDMINYFRKDLTATSCLDYKTETHVFYGIPTLAG